MKYAHNISFRVFSKPEDNFDLVKKGLINFVGLDDDQLKKANFEVQETTGLDGEKIYVLSLELVKNKQVNDFLEKLKNNLSEEDIDYLLSRRKPDDQANFYLRFDKSLLKKNVLKITESGDCYHVKVSVAAFPSNSVNALKVIKQIFINE